MVKDIAPEDAYLAINQHKTPADGFAQKAQCQLNHWSLRCGTIETDKRTNVASGGRNADRPSCRQRQQGDICTGIEKQINFI